MVALRWPLLVLVALGAGCSVLPPASAPPRLYDLGPPAPLPVPPGAANITSVSVTAPEWLGGARMHYRLTFDDPRQLRSYAHHAFVAPAAALLRERLRAALPAPRPAASPPSSSPADAPAACTLGLRLDAFEQRFASRASASVSIALRAEVSRPGAPPFAARDFSWSRRSAPDAPGAARALAALSDVAISEVLYWAAPLCEQNKVTTSR